MARVVLSCRDSAPQNRPNARELFDLMISAEGGSSRPPFRALSTASSQPSDASRDRDSSLDLADGASSPHCQPRSTRSSLTGPPRSGPLLPDALLPIAEMHPGSDEFAVAQQTARSPKSTQQ